MTRFINKIFTTTAENNWSNEELLPHFEKAVESLSVADDQIEALLSSVRYFLMGKRNRRAIDNWMSLDSFSDRAYAYEQNAELLLDKLAMQILSDIDNHHVHFDAIITTTSTGNIMPGLSYRIARKLEACVNNKTMMLDLGNVGCTGGIKALNFANNLNSDFKNILVVSVELPSTLINLKSEQVDVWQGNCTFGDGASALWIGNQPGQVEHPLKIEKIHYVQQSSDGSDLIRWGYSNYYTFNIEDESTFNKRVRGFLTQALQETVSSWKDNPHWAIHPAGITLLMRISRKLGIPKESMRPTISHYENFSNMSSSGILHIINQLQNDITTDEVINLITMGAGFNVIYGCLRKSN